MANIQVKDAQGDIIDLLATGAGSTGDPNIPTHTSRQESYTAPVTGERAGSTSAVQLPTIACKLARIKARSDNAGSVYIGVAGVTRADGTTDTTTGFELDAGDDTGWIPVDNLNRLYLIADNAGDDITYMCVA